MAKHRCTCIASLLFLIILLNPATSRYSVSINDKSPFLIDFSASRKEQQSRCTKRDLPCYTVSLAFIRDGICELDGPDPQFFREHFAKVGIKGDKAIADEGRRAAQIIYKATGFDFTDLPDEAYLYATVTTRDGSLTFQPVRFKEECKYRLTSIQIDEKTQYINKFVSLVAWSLVFNKDTKVGGTLNRVLPKGASNRAGSYVILPCEKNKDKNCQSIHNQKDPHDPIFINWKNRLYGAGLFEPGPFAPLNVDLISDKWGEGQGLGITYLEDDGKANGVQYLRFGKPNNH